MISNVMCILFGLRSSKILKVYLLTLYGINILASSINKMVRLGKRGGKRVGKRGGKRLGRGRRLRRARASQVAEYASLSVKRTLQTNGQNFQVNTLYNLMATQLTDFQRAVQVAAAYQHYRIKKIAVTFKPTFDTFSQNAAQTMSKMHLYYMIDKAGSIPTNVTLEGLKQMGARPFALDEKEKTVAWAPSVLESAMYAPGLGNNIQAKYQISPWLSTASSPVQPGVFVPSGIDHLGLYWYCEQLITPGETVYEAEVEVQFEFKKALAPNSISTVEAAPARVAVLNDSKDGIVGGADGV